MMTKQEGKYRRICQQSQLGFEVIFSICQPTSFCVIVTGFALSQIFPPKAQLNHQLQTRAPLNFSLLLIYILTPTPFYKPVFCSTCLLPNYSLNTHQSSLCLSAMKTAFVGTTERQKGAYSD